MNGGYPLSQRIWVLKQGFIWAFGHASTRGTNVTLDGEILVFTPEFGRSISEARKLPKTMSARNQLRVDRKAADSGIALESAFFR